jgi:MFS family permease
LFIAALSGHAILPIYGVVVLSGIVRSFNGPVTRSILPQLVPEEHFANAVAWSSSANQSANILGPSIGGFVYAISRGPYAVYALAMIAGLSAALAMLRIQLESKPRPREPVSFKTVLAGIHYIFNHKVVLGSISLDLFAVLLGGAVALLPVYAREILKTGPWGLGLLRCSPGIGAATMAIVLAHRPLKGRAGTTMLWCVAAFGVFTILFGLSHNLILSMLALVMVGATDMVSVITRAILVQLHAGRNARPRQCSGHDLHRRVQRTRPIRVGPHRRMVWHRPRRSLRRNWHSRRHRALGLEFSRAAQRHAPHRRRLVAAFRGRKSGNEI